MKIVVLNRRMVVSVFLLICVVCISSSNQFWRWMYPIGYQETIQGSARTTGVDPLLIASVIRVESKFNSEDVSHAGAIGLMQLMPDTAGWIAQQMLNQGAPGALTPSEASNLAEPTVNIRLGTWYVYYLTNRFDGNSVAAIAAYNAGPKRVQEWLADGTWNGQLNTINDIPVGETRHFVDRVFYNYDLYKRIYGGDLAWRATINSQPIRS